MGRFDPNAYATVEERLTEFWNAHPNGRVDTSIERLDPPLVVFCATVYRDITDTVPAAVGHAYEKEGAGNVNQTSYIENCETSAIGRALANLGYHGKKNAPRPSREEMEKVERMKDHHEAVVTTVDAMLRQITDAKMKSLDAKTQKGVIGLQKAHAQGDVPTMERGLEWLKGVVQLLEAGGALGEQYTEDEVQGDLIAAEHG